MSNAIIRLRKIVFTAAVTVALGFGATQAVAVSSAEAPKAGVCDPVCAGICQGFGGTPTWASCICCG